MSGGQQAAIDGIAEPLPTGEKVLWQGKPLFWPFALTAFRLREVLIYFALLAVLRIVLGVIDGAPALETVVSVLWLVPVTAAGTGLIAFLAYLSVRSTVYAITDQRIVMRYGVALPMTLNLPYSRLEQVFLHMHDGAGDIPVLPRTGEGLGYLMLWPHARPWEFSRAQPMLRSLAKAEDVARILGEAMRRQAAAHGETSVELVTAPAAARPLNGTNGSAPALAS